MRNKRVVIYGGTRLDPVVSDFVSALANDLLKNESLVLATGGFRCSGTPPATVISTDVAVLNGANKFAASTGLKLESFFETWLPEPAKDRREEGVDRFIAGKHEVLHGLSAQARRLRLVQIADVLITVHGEIHTALVLEMAMAIARPALPLAFTDGDSMEHWRNNRSYYVARLGISEQQARTWEDFKLGEAPADSVAARIGEITRAVSDVVRRNCVVLMPFRDELLPVYEPLAQLIKKEGFHPVRLDREQYAGDVRETVYRLLRNCDAILADVTDLNPNVMYEIGLAHAIGRNPLLLWRGTAQTMESLLPFYLRPQRIAWAPNPAALEEALKAYLAEARQGR